MEEDLVKHVHDIAPEMFRRCNDMDNKFFERVAELCNKVTYTMVYSDFNPKLFDVGPDIIHDDQTCCKELKKIRAYLQDCIYRREVVRPNCDLKDGDNTAYMYDPLREPEFYDRILLNMYKDLDNVVHDNGFKEAYVYQEWYTIRLLAYYGFQVGEAYRHVDDRERDDPEECKKCIYPNQKDMNFTDVLSSIDNIMYNICTSTVDPLIYNVPCSLMGL